MGTKNGREIRIDVTSLSFDYTSVKSRNNEYKFNNIFVKQIGVFFQ